MVFAIDERHIRLLIIILVVLTLYFLIRLPFVIIRGIFRWINQKPSHKTFKTDYGYNSVYDNNRGRWEYNERKRRWEPRDKTRMKIK